MKLAFSHRSCAVTTMKCRKKWDALAKLLFSYYKPMLFYLSRCRLRRHYWVNLRNRTGEERRRQTLCDKRNNNFAWKNFSPNFTFFWTDLFVKDQKTLMLVKITTKHASYSLVTFVTHKRFAVLFFLPSCCVNSLLLKLPTMIIFMSTCFEHVSDGRFSFYGRN